MMRPIQKRRLEKVKSSGDKHENLLSSWCLQPMQVGVVFIFIYLYI